MNDDFVSVEYRCDACGSVEWLESPLRPLRRFLTHFCSELGSYTVMRGIFAENGSERGALELDQINETSNS